MKNTIILLCLVFSSVLWAKRFANQYCQFELPSGWECSLEGTEWVCQSTNKERRKEAIIILAAKIRGKQDSLPLYETHLKQAKSFKLPDGTTQVSEQKYTKTQNINKHHWIDSLHLASEVPGFYTRYLATVKEDLGVVITFSVAKEHYSLYQGIFDRIIKTLRVFREKNTKTTAFKLKKSDNDLLGDAPFIADDLDLNIATKTKQKSSSEGDSSNFLLYLLIMAAIVFVLMKLKKKK